MALEAFQKMLPWKSWLSVMKVPEEAEKGISNPKSNNYKLKARF